MKVKVNLSTRFLRCSIGLLLALLATVHAHAQVYGWGWNIYGQLGDGSNNVRIGPVQTVGLSDVAALSGGNEFSVALKRDGTVWAWGANWSGQIGDGTFISRLSPVYVMSDVVAIDAGAGHTLALKSDGTVWSWGNGFYGQLGDGHEVNRGSPVQVSGLSNIVGVSAGAGHSIAVRSDGTVFGWGFNYYGSVGDGTSGYGLVRPFPVQVPSAAGAVSVKCGAYHNLAIMSDGSVRAWGLNWFGEIGNGTGAQQDSAVQVIGLSGIIEVAAGEFHSVALTANGNVYSWGQTSAFGPIGPGIQVGDGTWTPTLVTGLTDVRSVAAGAFHSVALMGDRTVRAWGWNRSGELGDGTSIDRILPVPVNGIANASIVAAGYSHNLTLVNANQPPVAIDDYYGVDQLHTLNQSAPGILVNDTDPDNNPLSVELVSGPSHASAFHLNSDGSFTYTPIGFFYGDDSFTYRAFDGTAYSEVATVHITVRQPGAQGFITGGGNFYQGGTKRTFGLEAKVKPNGTVQGNLEFQDHALSLNVKSTSVTWVYSPNPQDGYFSGTCKMSGQAGYTYFVEVHDRGEPGTNDSFSIWVFDSSGTQVYSSGGGLATGGNIQIH